MLGIVVPALLLAVLNIAVDPRGLYGTWLSEDQLGFHRDYRGRIARTELIQRGDWQVVAFGTSRVHGGFDPRDPVWKGARVLNMGLPATSLCELERVVELVLQENPLETAYLFADFGFFGEACRINEEYAGSRLNPDLDFVNYYIENAVGMRATRATIDTIRSAYPARTLDNGFGELVRARPDPLASAARILRRDDRAMKNFRLGAENLERFAAIAQRLAEAGVDVYTVYTPAHASILEMEDLRGRREDSENVVRTLARDIGRLAEQHPERRIEFWDFSGYRANAIAPLPQSGEPWLEYKDPGHFRPEFGARIIAAIQRGDGASGAEEPALGYRLDGADVEAHLLRKRREQAAYRARHPHEVDRVRAILEGEEGDTGVGSASSTGL